jgi:diguanylate cyclase (GGDEF)-like protein/PAS domain S-box-containing protein
LKFWIFIANTIYFSGIIYLTHLTKKSAARQMDINIQPEGLKNLEHRLEWLKAIVQFVPIGILQIDEDDKYTFVNPSWESITDCPLTKAVGINWWEVIHPDDQSAVFSQWVQAEKNMEELSLDCRIDTKNNEVRWIRLQTTFLFDDTGKRVFGSIQDITLSKLSEEQREQIISELLEIKQQLEVSSRTDPLTDLLNRRGMEEKLTSEKDRMERSGRPFSLILCDIDYFKKVNDTYGHDAGDYILTQVAKIIEEASRKQDVICRWGGEEFLLLLPETELKGAKALAEKLRKRLEKHVTVFEKQDIPVTLSLGVACIAKDQPVDACIKNADLKLYAAKEGGRNRVEF